MKNRTPANRAQLIASLRNEAISKDGTRWTVYTRWDHETRKETVTALERAGVSNRWSSSRFTHVEEGALPEDILDRWPSTQGVYNKQHSYIGAKRILKLLGEPVTEAEIRRLKQAQEDERTQKRSANLSRTVRKRMVGTEEFSTPVMDDLSRLVDAGTITEADLRQFRSAWAVLEAKLTKEIAS